MIDVNNVFDGYTLKEVIEYFVSIRFIYEGVPYYGNYYDEEFARNTGLEQGYIIWDEAANKIVARYDSPDDLLNGELFGEPFQEIIKKSTLA